MAVPAQQTAIAVLLSPAPLRTAEQGLVQLEALTRCPVGTVPLPVGAARLQEEASPRSDRPGLVQLEALTRCPVGVVPLPAGAARLQEEVSPRSDRPGSAPPSAAIEPLPHAPRDAAEAPASTSLRALGVGDASPVTSL